MNLISISFVFLLIGVLTATENQRIETPKYTLVSKSGRFEIRDYESMIVAFTAVTASYREATSTGFRRIAKFIFGGNSPCQFPPASQ